MQKQSKHSELYLLNNDNNNFVSHSIKLLNCQKEIT